MEFIDATFFDGVTATPKKINLFLDEKNEFFVFNSESVEYKWPVEDVLKSQFGNYLKLELNNQQIEIKDEDSIDRINSFLLFTNNVSFYQKIINLGLKVHLAIAIGIISLLVLTYIYVLPEIAEKAAVLIPETFDEEIGSTFFEEYSASNEQDSTKTKILNQFASQLKLNNKKSLKFTVIKSEVVNAFALPDGNIVIFTGLINKMENYPELVGLIGHEVSHVNHRHSVKMLCRNVSGYLFISTMLSDVNGIMATIGDNINSLQSLSFSRSFEKEADLQGLNIIYLNQIDPKGMSSLFTRLKDTHDYNIPEFLSSHPVNDERIEYINENINQSKKKHKENLVLKALFNKLKS